MLLQPASHGGPSAEPDHRSLLHRTAYVHCSVLYDVLYDVQGPMYVPCTEYTAYAIHNMYMAYILAHTPSFPLLPEPDGSSGPMETLVVRVAGCFFPSCCWLLCLRWIGLLRQVVGAPVTYR